MADSHFDVHISVGWTHCSAFPSALNKLYCSVVWHATRQTGLRVSGPGLAQTGLCSYRRLLEAGNFRFIKKRNCNYSEADLSFCFRLGKNPGFFMTRFI